MPAKAGIQQRCSVVKSLDSCLRGNDAEGVFSTFYETINSAWPKSMITC